MRSRSGLSVGQVVPSRGGERRWGRGIRAGAGFSPQPQAGAALPWRGGGGRTPAPCPPPARWGWQRQQPGWPRGWGRGAAEARPPRLLSEQMGSPAGPELARSSALGPRCAEGGRLGCQGQRCARPSERAATRHRVTATSPSPSEQSWAGLCSALPRERTLPPPGSALGPLEGSPPRQGFTAQLRARPAVPQNFQR